MKKIEIIENFLDETDFETLSKLKLDTVPENSLKVESPFCHQPFLL